MAPDNKNIWRQITVKFKEVKLTCVEIRDGTEWTRLIAHQNTTAHMFKTQHEL